MNNRKQKIMGAVLVAWVMLVFAGCPNEGENEGEGENPPSPPDGDQDLCYYVSSFGDDRNDGLTEDFPFRTLANAYMNAAIDAARKTVVVLSSLESANAVILAVPTNETVVIKGKEAGITITRNAGNENSVVEITNGAKISFENITVNGIVDGSVYHRALTITKIGTEVTLGKGMVITGKKSGGSYSDSGGGIFVGEGARLVMDEGSTVTGCEGGDFGGGICVYNGAGNTAYRTVLIINEGADISYNKASGSGGGVYFVHDATGIMTGGTIRNNISSTFGGGVNTTYNSTFTMYSGEISGNTATTGGGVYNGSNCTFRMYGGVIYGNEANNEDLKNTATDGAAFSGSGTKNGVALSTTNSTITAP